MAVNRRRRSLGLAGIDYDRADFCVLGFNHLYINNISTVCQHIQHVRDKDM
jgi:hypothetical protein